MLNVVVYQGRVGDNIEERQSSSGKSVCSFSIAVQRDYDREKVDWIDCVAWGELAGTMAKYVRKGAMIVVQGSTQVRDYTHTKTGVKMKAVECVVKNFYFCESKPNGTYEKVKELAEQENTGYSTAGEEDFKNIPAEEDDLPF